MQAREVGNGFHIIDIAMTQLRRPIHTAFRATPAERALIDAVAEREAKSVSELLRDVVLPAVHRRARRYAAQLRDAASTSAGEEGGGEGGDSFREECVSVVEPGGKAPEQTPHQDRTS